MNFQNVYFINGTAYTGKSTMIRMLAEKYNGIACGENYHNPMTAGLNHEDFPCLTYTRDLVNWSDFIRRTPEEYAAWIDGCNAECAILEPRILEQLTNCAGNRKIFVDTNIPPAVLRQISDEDHVLFMLADPELSVTRFFDRPDREKQFLYQLLLKEDDPARALENFRACLKKINSKENYDAYLHSGFPVFLRDDNLTLEETLEGVEKIFNLSPEEGKNGPLPPLDFHDGEEFAKKLAEGRSDCDNTAER